MSSNIFTKEVILKLKQDTRIPVIACVLGSNYGSVISKPITYNGQADGYCMKVTAVACDKVTEKGFLEYDCVIDVDIRDRE